MKMYAEWPFIEEEILHSSRSVLHSYPVSVGRDVAKSVVNCLFSNAFPSSAGTSSLQGLNTHSEVKWTMEVICFGLTLPLSEYETLKESVSIYVDWLSVIGTPKPNVPHPIRSDPLPYVRMMISHLENLFRPKSDNSNLSLQLALCQTVLRIIQTVAHDGENLDRETWEALLKFILNVSTILLTPPSTPNSLAEQMCDHLMQALFDVWMLSCHYCFPTPSLWKTFQMLFSCWRHHPHVVDWWYKITAALTSRLLTFMYGPNFPSYKISDENAKYIPKAMDNEHITQTWFRVLHLIIDPVELSSPVNLSKTHLFTTLAQREDMSVDVTHDAYIRLLPIIFFKAMKSVSSFVDAFLGIPTDKRLGVHYILQQISNPITPTSARKSKPRKSNLTSNTSVTKGPPASPANASVNTSISSSSPSSSTATWQNQALLVDMQPKPTPNRPQCNSILHLFGKWLFDAALANCKFESLNRDHVNTEGRSRTPSFPYNVSSTLSVSGNSFSIGGANDNFVSNPMFDSSDYPESSDAGRAEACGTLCRLMSCKKTREHILPMYLSRFYLVLSQGLLRDSKQVLASILLNSVDLLRIDLPGVTCLLPPFIAALDSILPDKELQQFKPYLSTVTLRRAAIHLLISMLPLPLHYTTLQVEDVQELWTGVSNNLSNSSVCTFQSLKGRLLDLLIGALQCEADPINTQIILGALLVALQDSSIFESVDQNEDRGRNPQSTENEGNNVSVDMAFGLYVQTIHLVSQKLDTWKSDLNISLAALELLNGLAKTRVTMPHRQECRRAVHELCQYIVHQCERPPPQHKRELHSMIVTAFHTLATWLLEHPYLLEEKGCLYEVLEIIELGISGSKSKSGQSGSNQNSPVMKTQKELSPVSLRVMEAAEGLLILVFEHVGAFPSPCSPSSTSSLLDERTLLHHTNCGDLSSQNPTTEKVPYTMVQAVPHFRYFVLHNGLLLSVLEQNLCNEEEPVPTVTVIIRNPSGRKIWTMQLRQTPRSDKLSPGSYLSRPSRPPPLSETKTYRRPQYRNFPAEVERIPLVNADCSIPPLNEVPTPEQASMVEKLHHFIEMQKRYDDDITKYVKENPEKMSECVPPQPTQEFETARLLLSHLNFLTLDSIKAKPQARLPPDLVMLNTTDPSFAADLEAFDSMPTRNHNTVFIFYLKSGQTEKHEILENVGGQYSTLQPGFAEFLLSLGWPVDVRIHPGWSGKVSTSWKLEDGLYKNAETIDMSKDGPSVFNGKRYILYYADATTEVAFVVPGLTRSPTTSAGTDTTGSSPDRPSLSLDLTSTQSAPAQQESPSSPVATSKPKPPAAPQRSTGQTSPDARVAVVWCEDYDSFDDFSLDKVESEMFTEEENITQAKSTDSLTAILIHPLESGLFRIHIHKPGSGKGGIAVPLVSGMVVSRRVLGVAVRMTAVNICNRRRLGSDSYSPPHVRRKQRIIELLSKYHRRCTEPEFFTAIFTDNKKTKDDSVTCGASSVQNGNNHPANQPLSAAS